MITNSEVFKVKFYFQLSSLLRVEPKDASWGHIILLLSVFQSATQILDFKNISYGLFYTYMYIPICTHVTFRVAGVTSDEHVHTYVHICTYITICVAHVTSDGHPAHDYTYLHMSHSL